MTKPNVIWIYCDELRADALGCYGNRYADLDTPNLDRIAASGALFRNCFCNSPVCVPSRTSVLSGLYPEQTGVYHNEGFWSNFRLEDPPVLIPEVFAEAGYVTANFGKVHIPHQLQPWMAGEPGRIGSGFAPDRRLGADQIRAPGAPMTLGGRYPADEPYAPARNTDNALAWLTSHDGPYFARISYLQPHTPVLPPPPYDTLYMDEDFPRRFSQSPSASLFERRFAEIVGGAELSDEEVFKAQAYYYGLVSWLDQEIGRLMAALEEAGTLENTILVFGADHGVSLGEGGGRYEKHTYAPEVHRVPLIVSWSGRIEAGQVRTDVCECLDCGRTLFDLAGLEAPSQFKGRALFADPAPEAVYASIGFGFADSLVFPNMGVKGGGYVDGHGWPRRTCVRTARYRLDKNVRLDGGPVSAADEDIFLADVVNDPLEMENLAGDPAYQDVVARLSAMIDRHVADSVEVPHAYVEGKKRY
jgi:choline-sulfatase